MSIGAIAGPGMWKRLAGFFRWRRSPELPSDVAAVVACAPPVPPASPDDWRKRLGVFSPGLANRLASDQGPREPFHWEIGD